MFMLKKNKVVIIALFGLCLTAFSVNAQIVDKQVMQEFSKDSEFVFQRKTVKTLNATQKGFSIETVANKDIKNLIKIDLIDPFENKSVKDVSINLELMGPMADYHDSVGYKRTKKYIEMYFDNLINNYQIDFLEMLNHIKINRIISSPVKYVVIEGKKYNIQDSFMVQVNRLYDKEEFNEMVDALTIESDSEDDQQGLDELKQLAIARYNEVINSIDNSDDIVDVSIDNISSQTDEFLIEGKKYKITLKK
jgi:hypothetical protein